MKFSTAISVFASLAIVSGCHDQKHLTPTMLAPPMASANSTNVTLVDATRFNDPSGNALDAPKSSMVSADEALKIRSAIAAIPKFPENPFSGCHARAELTARALEAQVPGKIFKVWLFSAQLITPSINGLIYYTNTSNTTTHWGYHVAAAYTNDSNRTMIVDTLISSEPIDINEWQSHFKVESFGVAVKLPMKYYLFNKSEIGPKDKNFPKGYLAGFIARNVFNGGMYVYDPSIVGSVAANHEGARDLAADAVASAMSHNEFSACEWKAEIADSIQLKSDIDKTPTPNDCIGARQLFDQQVAAWSSRGL